MRRDSRLNDCSSHHASAMVFEETLVQVVAPPFHEAVLLAVGKSRTMTVVSGLHKHVLGSILCCRSMLL